MIAAHIFRHNITGGCARRTAQDDDSHQCLLAEAERHAHRQKDSTQQHQLDKHGCTGRAELFDGLCALKARADAQQRHRRCAVAQHGQTLVQHRRKVDCQERERQARENTQYDRVGDDAAQRFADQAAMVRLLCVRRGDSQHQHRKDVVQRYACHDHQRHKTGIAVQILHKGHTQYRLRAAESALCERAHHTLIFKKEGRADPDGKKIHRRRTRTEKEKHGVELLGDASLCDIAEQQDRQQHLERQTVNVGQRLLGEKVFAAQPAAKHDDCKNRHGGIQTEYQIIHWFLPPRLLPRGGRSPAVSLSSAPEAQSARARACPPKTRSYARESPCGTRRRPCPCR